MRFLYLTLGLVIYSFLTFSCSKGFWVADDPESYVNEEASIDTLVVAHWNIGHLSLGKSSSTTIGLDVLQEKINDYRSLIDTIGADLIGICEYEPTFSLAGDDTKLVLFGPYKYSSVGNKYSYNCNALFSTIPINTSFIKTYPKAVQSRYYLESTLKINSKDVLFVETHLDWNEGVNGANYRKSQIAYLSATFSKFRNVIICGDFNVSNESEYSPFVNSGFSLVNTGDHGTHYTYPADNPKHAIDNIIVKGFSIISVDSISDEELSDHSLLRTVLVIK